jgi:uncharacterized protein (DUF2141 family)
MMKWIALTVMLTTSAQAAQVTVTVSGVRDAQGTVRVAICPQAEFLKPDCPYVASALARAGSVAVTFKDVPPGIYAAQAFHDANNNGVLDRTLLGMPAEGMGFSNNARMLFGPPKFPDAAFTVGTGDIAITLDLKYY